MTASKARKRANYARNFGLEADAVRASLCVVNTAAVECGIDPGELLARGWRPCRGDIQAAHIRARGMGSVHGGRFDLAPMCAAHHDEAGEQSGSKREAFERLYVVKLRDIADRLALEHPRPLGIRGLADRFAWWQEHEHVATVVELESLESYVERLEGYDRAALYSSVRRRMDTETAARKKGRETEAPGCDECDMPDDDDDLDALAEAVAVDLGGPFMTEAGICDYLAQTICKLAGGWT